MRRVSSSRWRAARVLTLAPLFLILAWTALAASPGTALPAASTATASSRARDLAGDRLADFVFEIERQTQFGQSVFVSGSLPALGDSDPARAIRLSPREYPIWRAAIALPRGTTFSYEYLIREDAADRLPDPTNATPIGEVLTASTPAATPEEVRVSAIKPHPFASGGVIRSDGQTSFFAFQAESPEEADILRLPRALDAFWFLDDEPFLPRLSRGVPVDIFPMEASRTYYRSGQIYDYPPAATATSNWRLEVINNVSSPQLGNSRSLRVYLPRGYDTHPRRVYPVLYMHDGQNIFDPGGPFGSWSIEDALFDVIAEGSIPEVVVVGIDNTNGRLTEYVPPYSSIDDPGRGDLYAAFVVETVLPLIESRYRVATDPDRRGVAGSSLGGLISVYIAWEYPEVFGRAASLSGSFQLDEIIGVVATQEKRPIRIYLDSGNEGQSADGLFRTNDMRDALLSNGYVLERDLFHVIGYGDSHNEAAWARRSPDMLRTLFPASDFDRLPGDVNGDGSGPNAGDIVSAVNLATGDASAPDDAPAAAQADHDGSGTVESEDAQGLAAVTLGAE
jgi:predicted alpha/beta superfamily hydrolase